MIGVEHYNQTNLNPPYDAIIIGSGLSGLTTASLLSKVGKKVLVLESHHKAGGFTHTFKRKGYEWDVGLHYVGDLNPSGSMFRFLFDFITDGKLKWVKTSEIYDKAFFGDTCYEFVAGEKNFQQKMETYFPEQAGSINQYLKLLNNVKFATAPYFAQRCLPDWIGSLINPLMTSPFMRYAGKTTKEMLTAITSDPKLIGVLTTQWGDCGLPPSKSSFAIHSLIAGHYMEGAYYPVGGSSQIAKTIAPVIANAGGAVCTKAEVKNILIENNKAVGVQLQNGERLYANYVVSSVGVFNTFGKLLTNEIANQFGLIDKLKKVKRSNSHIGLYVGLDSSVQELGLEQSNYWIFPGYDHDMNVKNFINNYKTQFPSIFVSFASAKDPEWSKRNPNKATLQVVSAGPFELFKKWENTEWMNRGEEYLAFKEELASRLMETVYGYIPQLRGKVDYMEISTPLSTKHFCKYDQGEIYGLSHVPERFKETWLKPVTPINNLYLTGQDTLTAGIGSVMLSGVMTALSLSGPLVLDALKQVVPVDFVRLFLGK